MTPLDWYAKRLAKHIDKPLEVLGETLFDADVAGDFWEKEFIAPRQNPLLVFGVDVGLDADDRSYNRAMDHTRCRFLLKVGDHYWSYGIFPNECPFVAFVPPRQNYNLVWDPSRHASRAARPASCKLRVRGWTLPENEFSQR